MHVSGDSRKWKLDLEDSFPGWDKKGEASSIVLGKDNACYMEESRKVGKVIVCMQELQFAHRHPGVLER